MAPHDPTRDYYAILGVAETATAAEIKAAYHRLMRGAHPDVNADRPEEANVWAQTLNEAYGVLSNAVARAEYDRMRVEFRRAEAAARQARVSSAPKSSAAGSAGKSPPPRAAPGAARSHPPTGTPGPSLGQLLGGLLVGLAAIGAVVGIGLAIAAASDETA